MSINSFLEFGGSLGDLSNGTISIFAKTISAANLEASFSLKTDSLGVIQTNALSISDTLGLQTILDSKIGTPLLQDLDVNKKTLLNIGVAEFVETSGSNVISMKAPSSITTGGHDFILPSVVGGESDVLTRDGAGGTSWELGGNVSSFNNFSNDNRIVITDTVAGIKNLQQSALTISDAGDITTSNSLEIKSTNLNEDTLKIVLESGSGQTMLFLNDISTQDNAIEINAPLGGVTLAAGRQLVLSSSFNSRTGVLIQNTSEDNQAGVTLESDGGDSQLTLSCGRTSGVALNFETFAQGETLFSAGGKFHVNNTNGGILLQSAAVSPTSILLQGTGLGSGIRLNSFSSDISLLADGTSANITLDSSGLGSIKLTHAGVLGNGIILDSGNRLLLKATTDIILETPQMLLEHKSIEDDEDVFRLDINAAGFADIKAMHNIYTTGPLNNGDTQSINLVTVDESLNNGGRIFGHAVNSTEIGSSNVHALGIGTQVNPILQKSGTFNNANSLLNIAVNVLVALSVSGAGNITVFVANNDNFTIGDTNKFSEIEFILDIGASQAGVKPTFEFSTGVGTWSSFSPIDGTSQFRNTGIVSWSLSDITNWLVGAGSEFLIRISRTRVSLAILPILDLVQISATIEYSWNLSGDLKVNTIVANEISYPPRYLDRLSIEWVTVFQLLINTGNCRDSTNSMNLNLSTSTVTITNSGPGGLQSGSSEAANTWYKILIIGDSTGINAPSTLLVPQGTSFIIQDGFDKFRILGHVRNNASSNFRRFTMHGADRSRHITMEDTRTENTMLFETPPALDDTFETLNISAFVPEGTSRIDMQIVFDMDADGDMLYLSSGINTQTIAETIINIGLGISTAALEEFNTTMTNFAINPSGPSFDWAATEGNTGEPQNFLTFILIGYIQNL